MRGVAVDRTMPSRSDWNSMVVAPSPCRFPVATDRVGQHPTTRRGLRVSLHNHGLCPAVATSARRERQFASGNYPRTHPVPEPREILTSRSITVSVVWSEQVARCQRARRPHQRSGRARAEGDQGPGQGGQGGRFVSHCVIIDRMSEHIKNNWELSWTDKIAYAKSMPCL